jgi:hypothetical protein
LRHFTQVFYNDFVTNRYISDTQKDIQLSVEIFLLRRLRRFRDRREPEGCTSEASSAFFLATGGSQAKIRMADRALPSLRGFASE